MFVNDVRFRLGEARTPLVSIDRRFRYSNTFTESLFPQVWAEGDAFVWARRTIAYLLYHPAFNNSAVALVFSSELKVFPTWRDCEH